jgi:hypothetical protein
LIGQKSPAAFFADIGFVAGGNCFIGKKVAWRRFLQTSASLPAATASLAKSRLAALFADIGFVAGGKKRGFCRLRGWCGAFAGGRKARLCPPANLRLSV